MNGPVDRKPIELPQWYACLAAHGPAHGGDQSSSPNAPLRIGPLTVFRPTDGCEIATFGHSADPSVVLFDGYLFDRELIATELAVSQSSIAELVGAAYRRWGAGVFDKLDGSYLIAVWDAAKGRLIVGHDTLGRHPIFFAPEPTAFWFSSNVLALASSGHVSNTPNRLSLALSMLFYWPEAGQTFFDRIRRVRPNSYLEVSPQLAISTHTHGEPPPEDDDPYLSESEVLEQFEPALIQAVERCMALAPQGIMLSGGVDSVVVAALAARSAERRVMPPLVAASARSGRALSYEEVMQSKVSEILHMPHLISLPADQRGGRDGISLSLEAVRDLPGPPDTYWVGSYTGFYRHVARQNLSVLLTGSGGDDWLGVGSRHAADLIRRLQFGELFRFMKASTGTGGVAFGKAARRWLWAGGVRPLIDMTWARVAPRHKAQYHRKKWYERLPSWLCPDDAFREELVEHLLQRRTPSLTREGKFPRNYYRHAMRTMMNPHLSYEFERDHHVQSLCGVRLLSPYHDSALVRFFSRIPPRALIHGDRYKGLLRPVAAKCLPGLGLENQRKSYSKESQDFMREQLRKSVTQIWPAEGFLALGRLGIVDPVKAEGEIAESKSGGLAHLTRMFTLMGADRWLRDHTDV